MDALAIAVGALAALVLALILYVAFIQRQLRSINRQLDKRLAEHTRQPIRLELLNRELNALAVRINQCLKAEENLRLQGIREEKNFKELIANISHDLRTPLTAIKGYQQLMANDDLSDDQRERLRIARKHAEDLGRLIEHFFEYAYLLNAEQEPPMERINVTNLVAECVAAAVPALEQSGLAVRLEEAPPLFALADRDMLARIVQNLIRNCVQHAHGHVEIRLAGTADRVAVSFGNRVKNGVSLDVKRLFDRFYTGDRARGGSTGLGLAIVRLLAERMGGSARAALQEGLIEICVELPAYQDERSSRKVYFSP